MASMASLCECEMPVDEIGETVNKIDEPINEVEATVNDIVNICLDLVQPPVCDDWMGDTGQVAILFTDTVGRLTIQELCLLQSSEFLERLAFVVGNVWPMFKNWKFRTEIGIGGIVEVRVSRH